MVWKNLEKSVRYARRDDCSINRTRCRSPPDWSASVPGWGGAFSLDPNRAETSCAERGTVAVPDHVHACAVAPARTILHAQRLPQAPCPRRVAQELRLGRFARSDRTGKIRIPRRVRTAGTGKRTIGRDRSDEPAPHRGRRSIHDRAFDLRRQRHALGIAADGFRAGETRSPDRPLCEIAGIRRGQRGTGSKRTIRSGTCLHAAARGPRRQHG